jgi:hypothetical protein
VLACPHQEALLHGAEGWRLLDSLSQAALGRTVTRKPVLPSAEEVAANPRSRSAKLRVFQRAGGPDSAGGSSAGDGSRRRKRQRQDGTAAASSSSQHMCV